MLTASMEVTRDFPTPPFPLTMPITFLTELSGANASRTVSYTHLTGGHPILPELRQKDYQYNAPVHIGRNCWLGAGVIVVPGITIGENSVIGAGSIVTKDIPPNVLACLLYTSREWRLPDNKG